MQARSAISGGTFLIVCMFFGSNSFAATPFSFRGITLGMSLSELKNLSPSPFDNNTRLICNSSTGFNEDFLQENIFISDQEEGTGIVKCAFDGIPTFGRYVMSSVNVSLLPPRPGAEPIVFNIKAKSLVNYDEIRQGLIEKLGPPLETGSRFVSWSSGNFVANLDPETSGNFNNGFDLSITDEQLFTKLQQAKANYKPPAAPL